MRQHEFNSTCGFDRGKHFFVVSLWWLVKSLFFNTSFPWPSFFKVYLLRLFGANLGCGIVIKPRVNIHHPWMLSLGDSVWLGEEVNIINFEDVSIEHSK